jgi:uncharacterized protein (TIGR02246 family)
MPRESELPSRLSLSLLILLFFATQSAPEQVQPSATEQIPAIRADWCKYLRAKQLEPEMALYAPDAVFLSPAEPRVVGLPAIRNLFVKVMAAVTSNPTLRSINLEVSGDLAYDSGEYDETLTDVATAARTEVKGAYLMVLKRQPDGQWRIQQQMWSVYR